MLLVPPMIAPATPSSTSSSSIKAQSILTSRALRHQPHETNVEVHPQVQTASYMALANIGLLVVRSEPCLWGVYLPRIFWEVLLLRSMYDTSRTGYLMLSIQTGLTALVDALIVAPYMSIHNHLFLSLLCILSSYVYFRTAAVAVDAVVDDIVVLRQRRMIPSSVPPSLVPRFVHTAA